MPSGDELYALVMDGSPNAPLHGVCAEKKYGDDMPSESVATAVYYGDHWRGDVTGICPECDRLVDPYE